MNGNGTQGPQPVPSGLTEFALADGRRFALDLVAANRELSKIAQTHQNFTDGSELEPWVAWLKTQTGVDFNQGQADWLWRHVVLERERDRADFTRELQSLSSTALTPEVLPAVN